MPIISRFFGIVIKMNYEDELIADWALAVKNDVLLDIIPLKRGD